MIVTMKKNKCMLKKVVFFALAIALVFGMIPGIPTWMIAKAATTKTVNYIDADGNTQTTEAIVLTGNEAHDGAWSMIPLGTAGTTTYYIVERKLTYVGGFILQGDVVLILGDNAHLTINGNDRYVIYGSYDTDSNGGGDNLTITSQSLGNSMGKLTGRARDGINAKNITINGGDINISVTGAESKALKAFVNNPANNVIVINGGKFTSDSPIFVPNDDTCSITLGYNSAKTSICAGKYGMYITDVVKIADGKRMRDEYGNVYSGTLTYEQRNLIEGKTLTPADFAYAAIEDIPDQIYTGDAIEPEPTVKIGEIVLSKDVDYTVSYSNNTVPGTATVTVTGMGNYSGTLEKTFNIINQSTHNFTYSASSNTITAICSEDACPLENQKATLTINAPESLIYDGAAKTATISGDTNVLGTPEISYQKKTGDNTWGEATNTAPKDVGTYKASITLGTGSSAATASVEYTIAQKTVTISGIIATARDYEAGNLTVALSGGTLIGVLEGDAVTVDLDEATGTMADANAGVDKAVTVTGVKLSGTDAGNYTLMAQPTDVTVTINKIAYTGIKEASVIVRSGQTTTDATLTLPALPDEASYAITGTVGGTTPALISGTPSVSGRTLTVSTTSKEDQISATINIAVTGATNYKDYNVVVTVTAKNKDEAGVTINGGADKTVTYGAADFTLTKSVTDAGTGTGVWTWTSSEPSVAEIGEHTGTVTIKKVGTTTIKAVYESATTLGEASLSFTVNPKTLGITWSNTSFTYDKESHVPTATLRGVKSGDDCTVSVTGSQTDAGTNYTATASLSGEDKDNYSLPEDKKTCSFSINKACTHPSTKTVIENKVAATCVKDGTYDDVVICARCGKEISRETKTEGAPGHSYGTPTYTWSSDNKTCTATAVCNREGCTDAVEGHKVIETVNTTSAVKIDSSTDKNGVTTYTATFTNKLFEKQSKDVEDIELKAKPETPVEQKPTETTPTTVQTPSVVEKGKEVTVEKKGTFEVTSDASSNTNTVEFTAVANTKAKSVTIPDNVTVDGKKYEVTEVSTEALKNSSATTVTIGKNVTTLAPEAFKGSNVKTITIKSKKLTKQSVKNAFKGLKVKKLIVKVKVGSKKENKKYIKKYKKFFTKKNIGVKAVVK